MNVMEAVGYKWLCPQCNHTLYTGLDTPGIPECPKCVPVDICLTRGQYNALLGVIDKFDDVYGDVYETDDDLRDLYEAIRKAG